VEDGAVVGDEEWKHSVQHVGVRRRKVYVAAPDPAAVAIGQLRAKRCGLRIVGDHYVPVTLELACIDLAVLVIDLPVVLREPVRVPLEGVVEHLGDVEELLSTEHDLPVGLESDVAHEWQQRIENLRDPAAHRGGAHVKNALAL
jgi:hypothetical protein